jgi:hypothetical protein
VIVFGGRSLPHAILCAECGDLVGSTDCEVEAERPMLCEPHEDARLARAQEEDSWYESPEDTVRWMPRS